MSKHGKISSVKKDYSNTNILSMDKSLAAAGLTRVPGTGIYKYPYKEITGKYRTGLDPDAAYIKRIKDPQEQELERERVQKLKTKLEEIFNVDLGPTSSFWNYKLKKSDTDDKHVSSYKLMDGDNYFDLSNPLQELTFAWLRVHPTIASSLQAYERGEYPSDTQFYVSDENLENEIVFKKKKLINDAVMKLNTLSPDRRRKVARLLGLPVSEDTKEEIVYNLIDDVLKKTEFTSGKYSGISPVKVFLQFADMKENILHVKDLVKQAVAHSILRFRSGGKLYKGEYELAGSEDDYVKFLLDEENQEDLINLEQELKAKKLASV
jgi:hypothetical protein